MKWLEIIKLRSAGIEKSLLEEFLRSFMLEQRGELIGIKTYRHAALENDLSVHLYWDSEKPKHEGSALGLHLIQALKEFGLVDYSIWIEEHVKGTTSNKKGGFHDYPRS